MVAIHRFIINSLRSVVLFVVIIFFARGIARADSYNVNASVPYPAPSQAATVNGSLDGTTVDAALQTLTGSCQLQNPADAVSVWRNGSSIGSAPCNGRYSLQVMLQPGDNLLTVRTVNASQLYGPDATPFTITLVLPVTPTPPTTVITPDTPVQDETPAQVTASTNAGASTDLNATTVEPFSTLDTNNDVAVHVTVGGGQTPYTIRLDWGDGSTESHSVNQAGVYTFTHNYQSIGSYVVRGNVHDVLGASTVFMYAVVSGTPTVGASSGQQQSLGAAGTTVSGAATAANGGAQHWLAHHWKPVASGTAALALGGFGYLVGAHHAVQQTVVQSTRAVRARGKQLPKTKRRLNVRKQR